MSGSAENNRWYAVVCRSRHEQVVTDGLTGKGFTTFCPRILEIRKWSDRRKEVEMPLFPGYVFVRINDMSLMRLPVLQTTGVAGFVGNNMRTPLAIPDKEIEDVQTVVNQRKGVSPYPSLAIGQRVRILGGAFDGVEGTLMGRNGEATLVISIQLIQRSISLQANNLNVVPVASSELGASRYAESQEVHA
jgi:transcriptional antiterminator NusG